jgi:enoyl-CoA hydratase
MAETFVTVERQPDGVALVRLDRPKANALSAAVLGQLEAAAKDLHDDPPGAVVLWGGRRIFAAGADIVELEGIGAEAVGANFAAALGALAAVPRATIAAVNGFALGGGLELALACDFAYAVREARFGFPEVIRGIMPGAGGTQFLPRAVGERRAKEIILSGESFGAAEALEWGIVNRLCERDALLPQALATGRTICGNAPLSVRQAKRAIHQGLQLDLTSGLRYEVEAYNRLVPTEDRREGVRAFNEKRKPDFTGR